MLEKDIENLIAKYPEEFFPDSGFKLIGQQIRLGKCYADIIFEDKYSRKVIVEVKRGILSREHSGQVIEYYGLLKIESPDERVELILCANIIPVERKKFLETVGIECKELGINLINQVAQKYNYTFMDAASEVIKSKDEIYVSNNKAIPLNDIPDPNKVWIFQENPKRYNILKALDDPEIGNEISWTVKQHKNKISKGDIGLIWHSGNEAGIYAIGEILTNPMMMKDTEAEKKYYLIDSSEGDLLRLMVKIKILTKLIGSPILKTQLKEIKELQNLSILKMPRGTNFTVSIEEWNEIKKLLENR